MSSFMNKPVVAATLCSMVLFFTTLVASVHATSFNWSYEFGDMTVASGMLEGDNDPSDSNVVVVTAMMGTWTGDASWTVDTVSPVDNIVTKNGEFFNLIVVNDADPSAQLLSLSKFLNSPGIAALINEGSAAAVDDPMAPERWSLTAKTLDTPATWTLMLFGGTGMLGLLAWARRRDTQLAAS